MKVSRLELERALGYEGDFIKIRQTEIGRLQAYAALGWMESDGKEEISIIEGCPCIPGSPCFPACAEQ